MKSISGFETYRRNREKALLAGDPLADFRNFVILGFRYLPGSPKPSPMQIDFADRLQNADDRMLLQVFRGFGKSVIVGLFCLYALRLYPQLKILVVSAEAGLAASMTTFCLNLIHEVPELSFLRPQRHQRQSTRFFDVGPATTHRDPSMRSSGILGRITGAHADLVIGDDIEVPNNSETVAMREKLAIRVEELEAIVNEGGQNCVIGTPQTDDTIYSRLTEQGYETLVYPARKPGGAWTTEGAYRGTLAPYVKSLEYAPDAPTDPQRADEALLLRREASMRRAGFLKQYMLDPSLSDAQARPLKVNNLIVDDLSPDGAFLTYAYSSAKVRPDLTCLGVLGDRFHAPGVATGEFRPYQARVMYVDPAGAGKDETAYAIVGQLNGNLFLLDCGGFVQDGSSEEVMTALLERAKLWSVPTLQVESNFGMGTYGQLLQRVAVKVHKCRVEDVRSKGKKLDRILNSLDPLTRHHRLIVNAEVIARESAELVGNAQRSLIHQLSRITNDTLPAHDDRLEAVAGACAYFADRVGSQAPSPEAEEAIERRWLDDGLPILAQATKKPGLMGVTPQAR